MATAFNQGEDTIEIGITVAMIGEEQEITVPGADTELMVSNLSLGTVFVSDSTGKGKAGLPIIKDYVVVTSNPGTLYLTAYGQGVVYITPGASA